MDVSLHANATTTPKVRGYIQRSRAPVAELADELGVSETTIVSRVRRAREVIWQLFEDHGYPGLAAKPGQATLGNQEDLRQDVLDVTARAERPPHPGGDSGGVLPIDAIQIQGQIGLVAFMRYIKLL